MMGRILVDHAAIPRRPEAAGGTLRVRLDERPLRVGTVRPDLLDLDAALSELAAFDGPPGAPGRAAVLHGLPIEDARPGDGGLGRHREPRVGDREGVALQAAPAEGGPAAVRMIFSAGG
jgi:hypothetical protein